MLSHAQSCQHEADAVEFTARLKSLTTAVNMANLPLDASRLAQLSAAVAKLPANAVTHVDLTDCNLDGALVPALCDLLQLGACGALAALNLSANPRLGDDVGALLLKPHYTLSTLLLDKGSLLDDDAAGCIVDAVATHCPHLERVGFGRHVMAPAVGLKLAGMLTRCHQLSTLRVSVRLVDTDGVRAMAEAFEHADALTELDIVLELACDDDNAVERLLVALARPRLVDLVLDIDVEDTGVAALCEALARACPALQRLAVRSPCLSLASTLALADCVEQCCSLHRVEFDVPHASALDDAVASTWTRVRSLQLRGPYSHAVADRAALAKAYWLSAAPLHDCLGLAALDDLFATVRAAFQANPAAVQARAASALHSRVPPAAALAFESLARGWERVGAASEVPRAVFDEGASALATYFEAFREGAAPPRLSVRVQGAPGAGVSTLLRCLRHPRLHGDVHPCRNDDDGDRVWIRAPRDEGEPVLCVAQGDALPCDVAVVVIDLAAYTEERFERAAGAAVAAALAHSPACRVVVVGAQVDRVAPEDARMRMAHVLQSLEAQQREDKARLHEAMQLAAACDPLDARGGRDALARLLDRPAIAGAVVLSCAPRFWPVAALPSDAAAWAACAALCAAALVVADAPWLRAVLAAAALLCSLFPRALRPLLEVPARNVPALERALLDIARERGAVWPAAYVRALRHVEQVRECARPPILAADAVEGLKPAWREDALAALARGCGAELALLGRAAVADAAYLDGLLRRVPAVLAPGEAALPLEQLAFRSAAWREALAADAPGVREALLAAVESRGVANVDGGVLRVPALSHAADAAVFERGAACRLWSFPAACPPRLLARAAVRCGAATGLTLRPHEPSHAYLVVAAATAGSDAGAEVRLCLFDESAPFELVLVVASLDGDAAKAQRTAGTHAQAVRALLAAECAGFPHTEWTALPSDVDGTRALLDDVAGLRTQGMRWLDVQGGARVPAVALL